MNSNLVENQISCVDDHFDPYENKIDKLARRIDLLEINLSHYFNK